MDDHYRRSARGHIRYAAVIRFSWAPLLTATGADLAPRIWCVSLSREKRGGKNSTLVRLS